MLNDELIGAYLDGELDADKRALVDHLIVQDAGAAARLERVRHSDGVLRRALPRIAPDAHDPIAAMILNEKPVARLVRPAPRWAAQAMALAAAAALGVFGERAFAPNDARQNQGPQAMMGVGASLQHVLDTTPSGSSVPMMGGEAEIALSFQNQAGEVCREFRAVSLEQSVDALACKRDGKWQMIAQALTQDTGVAQYHTAGAGAESPIDAAISNMGSVVVLDEAEETALIRAHWREAH